MIMLKTFVFLAFLLVETSATSPTTGCPNDNSPYLTWDFASAPVPGDNFATGCLFGGEYNTINVIAGGTYTVDSCDTSWKTQLTAYDASSGALVAYNDTSDLLSECDGGTTMRFTAASEGIVKILIDKYDGCQNEYSCGSLHATFVCQNCDADGDGIEDDATTASPTTTTASPTTTTASPTTTTAEEQDCECRFDGDEDGDVGISDLLDLLSNWGDCP